MCTRVPANVGTDFWKIGPRTIEETRPDLRNVNFTRTSSHGDANLAGPVRQNPVQIREKRFVSHAWGNKTKNSSNSWRKKKNNAKERNSCTKIFLLIIKFPIIVIYKKFLQRIISKSQTLFMYKFLILAYTCAMNAFTRFDALAIRRRNALPSM